MNASLKLVRSRSSRYFIGSVLLITALFAGVRMFLVPLVLSTDGITYMETAKFLVGEGGTTYPERLLKPLGPFCIAMFAQFFNHDYYRAFLVLNVLLYFLFGIVAWLFARIFFRNDYAAFLATLLLLSAYPVLKYGLDAYTDLGSWMLYLLALLGILVYSKVPMRWNVVFTAIVIAIGLLWKEYSVLAGVTFGMIILTQSQLAWRERFLQLGILGSIVLIVFGLAQYVVYVQFHFSYLDWYRIGARGATSTLSEHSPWFMGKSLFAVSLLGWLPAVLGVFRLNSLSKEDRRLLLLIALPLLVAFLWGYVSSRLYFVFAPFLTLLAVHGLLAYIKSKKYQLIVVLIIVCGNFAWLFLSDTFRHFL